MTNYLTDIQILEDLTDAERKPILECATQVAKLEKQRTDFLKTKRRLTDTQFAQMQEEEENLPDALQSGAKCHTVIDVCSDVLRNCHADSDLYLTSCVHRRTN